MATFHPDYAHLTQGLPASQLALAVRRLTTGRKALPAEAVSELGDRQQEVLTAIATTYARKKERSRTSSQKRRDAARQAAPPPSPAPPPSQASADSEQLPDIEPLRLDELDDEPEPDEPDDEPEPEPAPAPRAPAPVAPAPAPVAPVPEKAGEPVRASASRRGRKLFVNQH